jgi:hypothetical protein
MSSGVEPLFPLAAGVILLLVVTAALFAGPVFVPFALTGGLFLAAGLFFGRAGARFRWGAALAILAPSLALSAFLVAAFGARWLLFPALAAGGVASGLEIRRRGLSGPGGILLGALWVGIVVVCAFIILPELFDRVSFTGFAPR